MPTYEYDCKECGERVEFFQSMINHLMPFKTGGRQKAVIHINKTEVF